MEKQEIISILKKWCPWEKELETGIRRPFYINRIFPYMGRKEAIALKGLRRAGKSTIMKQLMAELIKQGVGKKQILYLNLDDYGFSNDLRITLFEEALAAYKDYTKNSKKTYMFIDEIQKVHGWEKWIRTIYDRGEGVKFIVSGSSASLLSRELSTLLTGRNLSFRIMPLSFSEFASFGKKRDMAEYLKFGGFPEVVLEPSEEKKRFILQQYFEDIIHKDIIDRYNIRNSKQLMDIARYLVSASGSKISANKLSKVFGLSVDTLLLYVSYMVEACLLFEVTFFSYSAKIRHDVTKLPKLYAADLGLISIVSLKFSENRGQAFESAVMIKLADYYDSISYWADSGSEADFIAGRFCINVTSSARAPERETRGMENFAKSHKEFVPFLVALRKAKEGQIEIGDFLKAEPEDWK